MRRSPKAVSEVDVAIGQRLKGLRLRAGLSMMELGAALGVSFQQIQKYENGSNRLSLVRAIELVEVLGTTLDTLTSD